MNMDITQYNKEVGVSDLVCAIHKINEAVNDIAVKIRNTSELANETHLKANMARVHINSLEQATNEIGSIVVLIENISKKVTLLAFNAAIEAARAGQAGRAFSVVANEVKSLASETSQAIQEISNSITSVRSVITDVISMIEFFNQSIANIKDFSSSISTATDKQIIVLSTMSQNAENIAEQFKEQDALRLVEMSQTLVQLIVRNLYERTADVRWWATDDSLCNCLQYVQEEKLGKIKDDSLRKSVNHAISRLSLINRFYSVYLNLVLCDVDGNIVAMSCPDSFCNEKNLSYKYSEWFQSAMQTDDGDEYVVDNINYDEIHDNKLVAVYATAVRKNGKIDGEVLGVLGVFFDWEEQSRVIVKDEPNLTNEEWRHTRVLLLDNSYRIIAASDGKGLLETYSLRTGNQHKGSYVHKNELIAFAQTIGYQEYDGLGWYGVIIQKLL